MELKQQHIEFAKQVYGYNCGTGKDAKIFIKFIVNENGVNKLFNIPLLTLNSIQVFTATPKEQRYVFGKADAKGVSTGFRQVSGYITAYTFNETIGRIIRRHMKDYKPVEGEDLQLSTSGYITLKELDNLRHLDQLPPCDIIMFMTNPETRQVFTKTIYGCVFSNESHSIGNSAAMMEQYSFMAANIGAVKAESVSKETSEKIKEETL